MSDVSRREALFILGAAPLAAALDTTPATVEAATRVARAAAAGEATAEPRFFTPHECRTARILADLVIPADDRSGSATDAGVPEFMDFMLMERTSMQMPMRGGLAWLDAESRRRFGAPFADVPRAGQTAILDDIAWPARARPELSHGVAFFNYFRDFTASGFFSSRVGVGDLQYTGNTIVHEWHGCPPEALRHLGLPVEGE